MERLATILPRAVHINIELISLNILLKNNWERIIGQDLSKFIKFDKVLITKSGTLKILAKALGAAMILVRKNKGSMEYSIKLLTGFDQVVICFQHVYDA